MAHDVNHASGHQGSPDKGEKGTECGPIHTPMASGMIPPGYDDRKSTGGAVYNGLDAPYTKGTPTEMAEVSFDTSGNFGKVPKVND